MKLYLVQHAEARSKQDDPERPLSEVGRANINKVASFAAETVNLEVDEIIHSGKLRAKQTAEVLAEYLDPSDGVRQGDDLKALDDVSIWVKKAETMKKDIMLVGHLPYMSKISSLVLCGEEEEEIIDFHNGGIVCIEHADGEWNLQWIVIPQIL